MKTNFFKIVLPAFALMLAITASLAFTPAENSMADDALMDVWYQNTTESQCVLRQIDENACTIDPTSAIPCTVTIQGTPKDVFLKNGSLCNIALFLPQS